MKDNKFVLLSGGDVLHMLKSKDGRKTFETQFHQNIIEDFIKVDINLFEYEKQSFSFSLNPCYSVAYIPLNCNRNEMSPPYNRDGGILNYVVNSMHCLL